VAGKGILLNNEAATDVLRPIPSKQALIGQRKYAKTVL
jgi:hypothetical protein